MVLVLLDKMKKKIIIINFEYCIDFLRKFLYFLLF